MHKAVSHSARIASFRLFAVMSGLRHVKQLFHIDKDVFAIVEVLQNLRMFLFGADL
jgi:hypothetical protein